MVHYHVKSFEMFERHQAGVYNAAPRFAVCAARMLAGSRGNAIRVYHVPLRHASDRVR